MFPSVSPWLQQGSSRDLIGVDELAALQNTKTVIPDDRRRRTRWFDGRFFAAQDQIREQNYMLTRFADLGRAGGVGVVTGLTVNHSGTATVSIDPGLGITPSGEQVLIPGSVSIDLTRLDQIELIDAAFGLSRLPRDPATNRSGIFIIGLRPVEYTGNPIASYPTTINGPRTVQDGDIIEASAIVLIPYPDEGGNNETLQRRSRIARRIFAENGASGTPENVLPLAMVAMDRGVIQWLDVFLVRREVGMEHGSILSLGFASRALREAHVLQYVAQLSETLSERSAANRGQNFTASDYFEVLPPAGLMPSAAINPQDFSQIYFPSQVQCDLSIVPDDEMMVLIEESLLLPPLDLTAQPDEQESTSVLIVIPVPRAEIPNFKAKLTTLVTPVRASAPGIVFRRKPIESLTALTALRLPPPVLNTQNPIDAAWRSALARNPLLWYVRRRNLQIREDVTGVHPPADGISRVWALNDSLNAFGLTARFTALRQKAQPGGLIEITGLLSSPAFLASKILTQGAIKEFEQVATLDQPGVDPVITRFSNPSLGQGLTRMATLVPGLSDAAVTGVVGDSAVVPELDQLGRDQNDADLTKLTNQVVTLAKGANGAAQIAALIRPLVPTLELPA